MYHSTRTAHDYWPRTSSWIDGRSLQACALPAELAQQAFTLPTFEQVTDHERLLKTCEWMQQTAGQAPGPDRLTWNYYSRSEAAGMCRDISDSLRERTPFHFPARHVQVPKASGGTRTLALRSIWYRVIARCLKDALEPYFERQFHNHSHGFRPRRGTWSMLAAQRRLIEAEGRWVIATDDVRKAFDNVRIPDLVRTFGSHTTDCGLLWLIEQVLTGDARERRLVGIDQGSPFSPLALNLCLHHGLDIPFSEDATNPPWYRYADNLVYLCHDVSEGIRAKQQASQLLAACGLTLKDEDPIVDLRSGAKANLLGYRLGHKRGQLTIQLGDEAWANLQLNLEEAHRKVNPPELARQVLQGWIAYLGPAFESGSDSYRKTMARRILAIAARCGFREAGTLAAVVDLIQWAVESWVRFSQGPHIPVPETVTSWESSPLIFAKCPTSHDDCPF